MYQTSSAVKYSGGNDFSLIRGCTIQKQGGFGITLAGSYSVADHNTIEWAASGGIIVYSGQNMSIINNTVNNIGLLEGYGWSGVNGAIGVSLSGSCSQATIAGNTINATGYIGVRYDGTNNLVEDNLIEYTLLTLDDGGCLYTWGASSTGHLLRNNIVGHAFGNIESTDQTWRGAQGLYFDDQSGDMTAEGNTVYDCDIGIFVHNAHNVVLRSNMAYNLRGSGITFSDDSIAGTIYGCTTESNVLVSLSPSSDPMRFGSDTAFGVSTFANNVYCAPFADTIVSKSPQHVGISWWRKNVEPSAVRCNVSSQTLYEETSRESEDLLSNSDFYNSTTEWVTWPDSSVIELGQEQCANGMPPGCGHWYLVQDPSYSSGLIYNAQTIDVQVGSCFTVSLLLSGPSLSVGEDETVLYFSIIMHHPPWSSLGWGWNVIPPEYPASEHRTATFCLDTGDNTTRLNIAQDFRQQPFVYLDSVTLYRVSAAPVDPMGVITLVTNPTTVTKDVSVGRFAYYDVANPAVRYTCSVTLEPYSSKALFSPEPVQVCSGSLVDFSLWGLLCVACFAFISKL
eukprot:TRINITY_DN2388_c0_g1_i1.p1 TRINITY_DN2388_c0_g1~~TRINITY_DN2388_c0_g1_i1.p1  ORF type:complete len:566 (-),score=98.93 TRINITY_DN2388_c0_g1_i1:129-1826(-)